ncbi:hypothetical protein ACVIKP_002506 [Rhizobium leguminosarum]
MTSDGARVRSSDRLVICRGGPDRLAATARWFGRDRLRDAGIDLYPTGLDKLLARWRD